MYEYWFLNLRDPQDPDGHDTFSHHGTTYDFLELCAQIAIFFNPIICGQFVTDVMEQEKESLAFLRVTDWNCKIEIGDQTINVVKTPR